MSALNTTTTQNTPPTPKPSWVTPLQLENGGLTLLDPTSTFASQMTSNLISDPKIEQNERQLQPEPGQKGAVSPTQPLITPSSSIGVYQASELDQSPIFIQEQAGSIVETLARFGVKVKVQEVNIGPTVTQFAVELGAGIKLSKLTALADDLALALAVPAIRIEQPVLGRPLVGIQLPSKERSTVKLAQLVETPQFHQTQAHLKVALGRDVIGQPIVSDLTHLTQLLIAGTTGSGKSVCLNALICSLLLQYSPQDLRLIMVDPKMVELNGYNGIPHLLFPVIDQLEREGSSLALSRSLINTTNAKDSPKNNPKEADPLTGLTTNPTTGSDPTAAQGLSAVAGAVAEAVARDSATVRLQNQPDVLSVLAWAVGEMSWRYRLMTQYGQRNIEGFNQFIWAFNKSASSAATTTTTTTNNQTQPQSNQSKTGLEKLPYLVVIVDELADLMETETGRQVEQAISQIARKGRAAGVHFVLATQRPSADVITGKIKAVIPSRIAFAVSSELESRVILGEGGAEKLLGRGDMLFKAASGPVAQRLQGVYVSDEEIHHLVQFWRDQWLVGSQGDGGDATSQPYNHWVSQSSKRVNGKEDFTNSALLNYNIADLLVAGLPERTHDLVGSVAPASLETGTDRLNFSPNLSIEDNDESEGQPKTTDSATISGVGKKLNSSGGVRSSSSSSRSKPAPSNNIVIVTPSTTTPLFEPGSASAVPLGEVTVKSTNDDEAVADALSSVQEGPALDERSNSASTQLFEAGLLAPAQSVRPGIEELQARLDEVQHSQGLELTHLNNTIKNQTQQIDELKQQLDKLVQKLSFLEVSLASSSPAVPTMPQVVSTSLTGVKAKVNNPTQDATIRVASMQVEQLITPLSSGLGHDKEGSASSATSISSPQATSLESAPSPQKPALSKSAGSVRDATTASASLNKATPLYSGKSEAASVGPAPTVPGHSTNRSASNNNSTSTSTSSYHSSAANLAPLGPRQVLTGPEKKALEKIVLKIKNDGRRSSRAILEYLSRSDQEGKAKYLTEIAASLGYEFSSLVVNSPAALVKAGLLIKRGTGANQAYASRLREFAIQAFPGVDPQVIIGQIRNALR